MICYAPTVLHPPTSPKPAHSFPTRPVRVIATSALDRGEQESVRNSAGITSRSSPETARQLALSQRKATQVSFQNTAEHSRHALWVSVRGGERAVTDRAAAGALQTGRGSTVSQRRYVSISTDPGLMCAHTTAEKAPCITKECKCTDYAHHPRLLR